MRQTDNKEGPTEYNKGTTENKDERVFFITGRDPELSSSQNANRSAILFCWPLVHQIRNYIKIRFVMCESGNIYTGFHFNMFSCI